jgi:hypothetical protein
VYTPEATGNLAVVASCEQCVHIGKVISLHDIRNALDRTLDICVAGSDTRLSRIIYIKHLVSAASSVNLQPRSTATTSPHSSPTSALSNPSLFAFAAAAAAFVSFRFSWFYRGSTCIFFLCVCVRARIS